MKILSIDIKNFKQFEHFSLDFTEPNLAIPKDFVVLIGNNGTGKSTILQAIALVLGMATERLKSPEELEWPGFDFSLVNDSWRLPTEIKLRVMFTQEEIKATLDCYKRTKLSDGTKSILPSTDPEVLLTLRGNRLDTKTQKQKLQFQGRRYASMVFKNIQEGFDIFKKIGSVFWYHEHRQAATLTPEKDQQDKPVVFTDNLLRRFFAHQLNFHHRIEQGHYTLRPGEKDLFKEINNAWTTVFPGRKLVGSVPRNTDADLFNEPWFFLSDGQKQYELSEMSAGERVILPILIDFARLNINNSIILIDEIELHLHPPLQQTLINALRKLGENNQFIITTHSQSIMDVIFESDIIRMPE